MSKTYTIELDEYERDNLFWLLDVILKHNLPILNLCNTGDWNGQIHYKLEDTERGFGQPNKSLKDLASEIKYTLEYIRKTENDKLKDLINSP